MPGRSRALASVQRQLMDLEAIHEDVLVLRGGDTRAVLAVQGVNLALMSAVGRQAVLEGYRAFLNGLDGPAQAVVAILPRSLEPYLADVREAVGAHRSPTLARLALEHEAFVRDLAARARLTQRRLYLVVAGPAASSPRMRRSPWSWLQRNASCGLPPGEALRIAQRQLRARSDELAQQLHGIGLGAWRLAGTDLLRALDEILSPERSARQPLRGPETLAPPLVLRAQDDREALRAAA